MMIKPRLFLIAIFVIFSLMVPSITSAQQPLTIQNLENMVIVNTRSAELYGWEIHPTDSPNGMIELGSVFDSENIFYWVEAFSSPMPIVLQVTPDGSSLNIAKGDSVIFTYDGGKKTTVYLPFLTSWEEAFLYVGADGSTYWDPDLTQLAQRIPDREPLRIANLEDMVITNTRSAESYGWEIHPTDSPNGMIELGSIFDNENIFYWVEAFSSPMPIVLQVTPDGSSLNIAKGDSVVFTYDGGKKTTVYLPNLTGWEEAFLYAGADGATYWDSDLTQLAQAGSVIDPGPLAWATVDFDPDTLNLKSQGKWLTAYIELTEGFDIEKIDQDTIRILWLDDSDVSPPIYPKKEPKTIDDYDQDGIPDLRIKFDRQKIQNLLSPGNVTIVMEMNLKDGIRIGAKGTIRVIKPGPHHFKITRSPDVADQDALITLSIEVQDIVCQRVRNYVGSIRFESDDPYANLPKKCTFTPSDKGMKDFSIKLKTPGLRRIRIRDTNDIYLVGYEKIPVREIDSNSNSIKCRIKVPKDREKISGNRVTIMAEIEKEGRHGIKGVLFQYRNMDGDEWLNIPAIGINHPNPDRKYPYLIHWDMSGLSEGKYNIRAVASDIDNNSMPSEGIIVQIDNTDFDSEETIIGNVIQKRQRIFNNEETNVVLWGAEETTFMQVLIPPDAVESPGAFLKLELNPPDKYDIESFDYAGQFCHIEIESSQDRLSNSNHARINLSYCDVDNDGMVDGTSTKEKDLSIFWYNAKQNVWQRDASSQVDIDNNICSANVAYFGTYGLISPFSGDFNDILIYPNPYVPFDADYNNGKPYESGDLNSGIIFENIADSVEIQIYTVAGELVWNRYIDDSSSGRIQWDAKNNSGNDVASGIYFVVFAGSDGQRKISKLAIVR